MALYYSTLVSEILQGQNSMRGVDGLGESVSHHLTVHHPVDLTLATGALTGDLNLGAELNVLIFRKNGTRWVFLLFLFCL